MDEVLQVDHVSMRFHKREILHSLTFQVEQGTCFAFLGENGAGKSTMLHILSSVLCPSEGRVYVYGKQLDEEGQAARRKIGTVFQEDVLDGPLSVEQNLYYRGGLYLKDKKEIRKRICQLTRELGIASLTKQTYGTLSGGQRRIVQIARALLPRPSILLLDEPTAGLDMESRGHVWRLLKGLQKQEALTIFYTTHYAEELQYADRIGRLKNGILQIKAR